MLEEYIKKRHFTRTSEPAPAPNPGKGPLIFVVQKHAARSLHYDFRLEVDGVLKSWAVPNGPSFDPKVKRLAVMVEDHPIEYQHFEGIIPEGEYGAGKVIVWDKGNYSPDDEGKPYFDDRTRAQELIRNGLEKGKISIVMKGSKLKGSWALVKMQRTKNDWLLIKHHDEFADPNLDILNEDTSVLSGKTIHEIKENQSPPKLDLLDLWKIPGARLSSFPSFIPPMLASISKNPFSDPKWIFEPKLDGFRTLAMIQNQNVKLISRNGIVLNDKYPDLVENLTHSVSHDMVLDGELVSLDENGRSCFQCLQDYGNHAVLNTEDRKREKYSIFYYVFDILYLNGYDLYKVPLVQRKSLLSNFLLPSEYIRLVDYYESDGTSLYEAAIKLGMEGIIAKLKDSEYEAGHRSQNWLKIKAIQSDEFIIGGYTRGNGSRKDTFGALLLGTINEQGKLVFAGHVGSGFTDRTLADLQKKMDSLITDNYPFNTLPPINGSVTWLKPKLVAEVKFTERTKDGYLRSPVFLRLRDDKIPFQTLSLDTSIYGLNEKSEVQPAVSAKDPDSIENIVSQLDNSLNNFDLELDGKKISLTNLDKAIWPGIDDFPAVLKRDLLKYLIRVSPYFLPHLKDRPLTLTRYPNGITEEHFYQKHWTGSLPDFVQTCALSENESPLQDYLVCNNLATLLWLGQLANIDIHTWFSRITPKQSVLEPNILNEKTSDYYSHYPDFIIFDLDPYIYSGKEPSGAEPELNRFAFEQTCKVALQLKEILDSLSLNSFVKTSGKTGLHIYVPIIREFDFREIHSTAKMITGFFFQKHTKEVTMEWPIPLRTGKVFLDYNQNARGKTLASIYSPRPSPQATVSTPLYWSEVGKIYPTDFTLLNLFKRLNKTGDIWSDILLKANDLSNLLQIKEK